MRLLGPDLSQLALATLLVGLEAGLGVKTVVPPAEAGGIVADELLVMEIVVVGTSPERKNVAQAPGEIVTTVSIDGLEETEDDPSEHGKEVEVTDDRDPDDRNSNNSKAEEHSLDRGRILGSEAEGSAVRVVELVDVLIERSVVKRSVEPVMPGILEDEEDGDLESHGRQLGERDTIVHAEVGGDGVEQPDLGKLNRAVAQEDENRAIPLLLPGGQLLLWGCQRSKRERVGGGFATDILELVFVEVRDAVDNDPGEGPSEVDDLVHDESHDASGEDVVLHPKIPCLLPGLALSMWWVGR